MPKRFFKGLHIFFLYWFCCLLIGVVTSLISIGALFSSQYKVSKVSSIVARGALFPYIQISKLTESTDFLAWEKGLIILEDIPSFAQKGKTLQKTYTDQTPLNPELISSIQVDYSHLLSEWSSFQNLLSQSSIANRILKPTTYSKIAQLLNQNESILLSTDLFLNFISARFSEDKPVHFLILFQNNMELRPTGGFIGSYGILHLEANKPISFEIQDIYVPDGQLKGHVDPPLPIQEAFQQGFWKLRDANWHPDFPESVERVKWFFSEVNAKEFDGVIAVTFTPIQQLLSITGPVTVRDLNTNISSENVYQILQRIDNKAFFPGSTQKKDTLSAFANQLLLKLQHLPPDKYLEILTLINQQLTEKNILLSINDPDITKLATLNNWSGTLRPNTCSEEGCSQDYFSIFESNLGVNKSNCCVKRSVSIDKTTNYNLINATTLLQYDNLGPGEKYVGVAGDYKAFIRLYFPENTQIDPPIIDGKSYTEYIREMKSLGYLHPITSEGFSLEKVHGLQELGLWIVVPNQQQLNLEIQSKSTVFTDVPYSLSLQKQPGTTADFNQFDISFNQKELFNNTLLHDVILY